MDEYRYLVGSPEGLVKIVAQLISRRCKYWFYFCGVLPSDADVPNLDAKMLRKYEVPRNKHQALRLRREGKATVRYLRHGRHFLLLATRGESLFHQERQFHNIARKPLQVFGYSLAYRNQRASVRISEEQFRLLKDHFRQIATRYPCEVLGEEINALPFLRFTPVRGQLLQLVRAVNRERAAWGLAPIPRDAVSLRKTPLTVFE